MHFFVINRWTELPRIAALAVLYVLLAALSSHFASPLGATALISPQAGMALAALLILGNRCWPGIFIGAFAASLLQTNNSPAALVTGATLTLSLTLGAALLRRFDFDHAMTHTRDFFLLFLLAGFIAPGTGVLASHLALPFPPGAAVHTWLSNMLGIILVAPMLLIWRQLPPQLMRDAVKPWRVAEFAAMCLCLLLLGQIIFLGWQMNLLGDYPKGYLMFAIVIWAAIRFGRHIAVLILGLIFILGLFGASIETGYFNAAIIQSDQINFSIYFVVLILIGMLLSSAIRERNANADELREIDERFSSFMQHMPGIAFIKDAQQDIIYHNDSAEAQKIHRALPHPLTADELEKNRADDEIVLSDRTTVTSEVAVGEAGAQRTLLSIKFPVTGANDACLIGGLMLDITPRKRAEERVRQLTQLYQTLSHVNQSIVRLQSGHELFPLVCQMVVRDGGMQMAWIGIPNKSTGLIEPVASYGDAHWLS